MSKIEYRTLRCKVSQGIDWQTEGETLLSICEGLIAEGSENNIGDAATLLKELEIQNNLGIDHLEVLKELLRGIEKWALVDKIEIFEIKRKNYLCMLEKIILKLDELNDLRRLINVCTPYLEEDRVGRIESTRVLFKKLESNYRLGPANLRILKEILKETGEDELLREVEEFEKKRKDEDIRDRQRKEAEERSQARVAAVYAVPRVAGRLMGAVNVHCDFETVGGVVVAVGASVVLYKYSRGDNDIQQFANLLNGVILPAGNFLRGIRNGSLCFTVQAEDREALQLLWEQYQDNTLQTKLQDFLVTEEIKQLADGEDVIVNVHIDEQEYQDACLDFVMKVQVSKDEEYGRQREINRRNSDSVVYIKPKENEAAAVLSSLKTAEIKFQQEKIETLESRIDRISKVYREQEERDLEIHQLAHVADQPDDEIRGDTPPPSYLDWSRWENIETYLSYLPSRRGSFSKDSSYGSEKEFGEILADSLRDEDQIIPVAFGMPPPPTSIGWPTAEGILNPLHKRRLSNEGELSRKLPRFNVQKHNLGPPTYSFQAEETHDAFEVEVGREIKILFSTKDAKGNLFYEADNQVGVKIQALSGNFVKKKIEDNLNGNYTVSFAPDIVGPHSVTITVNGQPLTGSPWSVEVSPHQYKHAFDITVDEGSFSPAFAVNKETNEIAVIWDKLMLILSADHSLVRHFWLKDIILSMDFTINGSLVAILLSNLNRTLYLIDESGKSITEIGQGYLTWPMAVSVSHDGSIIVCDLGNSSVKVLSPDGTKLLQSFSDPHFQNFRRFSVYHQDMFFVSYYWLNACVKTFNKDGVFLYNIGGNKSAEGRLRWPRGLAIDKFDNLIVSEDHETLKVFTVEGNFLYKIEVEHKGISIAASNAGNLYVLDNDCIHVFQ